MIVVLIAVAVGLYAAALVVVLIASLIAAFTAADHLQRAGYVVRDRSARRRMARDERDRRHRLGLLPREDLR